MKHKYMDLSRTTCRPYDIITHASRELGVNLSYKKAWKSKEKALESLNGSDEDAYPLMPSFAYMLESCNSGSIVAIETNKEDHFLYFFHVFGWLYPRVVTLSSSDNCRLNIHEGKLS